jgi:hypothetical protein
MEAHLLFRLSCYRLHVQGRDRTEKVKDSSNLQLALFLVELSMSSQPLPSSHNAVHDNTALSFQSPKIRQSIVAAFWSIVLVGLPIWWATTTIERLPLPRAQVDQWQSSQVH